MQKKPPILVSTRGNGLVTFWNTRNIEELYTFQGTPDGENVMCLCLSETNDTLVTGDVRGYIAIYDLSAIKDQAEIITQSDIRMTKRFKAHTKVFHVIYIQPTHYAFFS